jgi:hypothetical protein
MWGPLVSLRRWWRPLPTVGHIFLCRVYYDEETGAETDVGVRDAWPEKALEILKQRIERGRIRDVVIHAMRPADARDFRSNMTVQQLSN